MKLFDKFKKAFGVEKGTLGPPAVPGPIGEKGPSMEPEPPIKPGKVDLRRLMRTLRGGFRLPARTHVYRKRKAKTVFIDGQRVEMSHRAARLHYIWTSMREANEIRRSHRERQLEARALRAQAAA